MNTADWSWLTDEPLDVYDYYDRPVLFATRDPNGRLFLAVLTEQVEGWDEWLYVQMSPERWQALKHGVMDLHDGFAKAETGMAWLMHIAANGSIKDAKKVPCADLGAEKLPDKGTTLLQSSTPSEANGPSVSPSMPFHHSTKTSL